MRRLMSFFLIWTLEKTKMVRKFHFIGLKNDYEEDEDDETDEEEE